MADVIQLTSTTPGIIGKIRMIVDNIIIYFPGPNVGTTKIVCVGGLQEVVKESIAEVDRLIEAAKRGGAVNGAKLVQDR